MPFYTHDNVPDSPINNFCTLNPIDTSTNSSLISDGNLRFYSTTGNRDTGIFSKIPALQFLYFELYRNDAAFQLYLRNEEAKVYQTIIEQKAKATEVWCISIDSVTGKYWARNTPITDDIIAGNNPTGNIGIGTNYRVQLWDSWGDSLTDITLNFGQDPTFGGAKSPTTTYPDANGIGQFHYKPPAGALALCTANLPEGPIKLSQDQTPSDHFKAVTWTNPTTDTDVTVPLEFQADLIWWKQRNVGNSHRLQDTVRGLGNNFASNHSGADVSIDVNTLKYNVKTVTSTGFTFNGYADHTTRGGTMVAWCWKAAGAPADNQAKIINEDGSAMDATAAEAVRNSGSIVPSKVSANRQNGFSIVKYNGNSGGGDVPHGLSQKPDMLIVRPLTTTSDWIVWHKGLEELNFDFLYFNHTNSGSSVSNYWGSTGITNTKFGLYVGGLAGNNYTNAGTSPYPHIAYCWHSVEGYSKFGSYVGNGSADGPFVYCGFRPAWLMVKSSSFSNSETNWVIYDNVREGHNVNNIQLYANTAWNEGQGDGNTGARISSIDLLSNGFKLRDSPWSTNGQSGQKFIFMAFAEQPFSGPANAR